MRWAWFTGADDRRGRRKEGLDGNARTEDVDGGAAAGGERIRVLLHATHN